MTVCPSCQSQVDLAGHSRCPFCGWMFQPSAPPGASRIQGAARPKIQVEVDLGIGVDRSGSSLQFAQGVMLSSQMIVDSIAAKARSIRCWLQSHSDLDEGEPIILHTDGGTPDQVKLDLAKIVFEGGGDPPEHHLDGAENLLKTVPWTADPRRARGVIVMFLTADTKPARSGKTPRDIGQEIRDRGILFYLVCQPTPALHELVRAAGGLIFQISNTPSPADMQNIAAQCAASITATVGSGGTVPMTV